MPIKSGRSDKKFCDSACKDEYYNAIKTKEHQEIKKIDIILKRNRRILQKIYNPTKPEKLINREVLLKAGFEFSFRTHHVITKTKANEFIFCYDFGYREMEKDKYKVIKSF